MADLSLLEEGKPYGTDEDTSAQPDYDMEGALRDGVKPGANGHFPDTYKLPNHITFSTDSKYSNEKTPGGVWAHEADGKWAYTPSEYVLQQHPAEELKQYFRDREPDAKLILPSTKSASPLEQLGLGKPYTPKGDFTADDWKDINAQMTPETIAKGKAMIEADKNKPQPTVYDWMSHFAKPYGVSGEKYKPEQAKRIFEDEFPGQKFTDEHKEWLDKFVNLYDLAKQFNSSKTPIGEHEVIQKVPADQYSMFKAAVEDVAKTYPTRAGTGVLPRQLEAGIRGALPSVLNAGRSAVEGLNDIVGMSGLGNTVPKLPVPLGITSGQQDLADEASQRREQVDPLKQPSDSPLDKFGIDTAQTTGGIVGAVGSTLGGGSTALIAAMGPDVFRGKKDSFKADGMSESTADTLASIGMVGDLAAMSFMGKAIGILGPKAKTLLPQTIKQTLAKIGVGAAEAGGILTEQKFSQRALTEIGKRLDGLAPGKGLGDSFKEVLSQTAVDVVQDAPSFLSAAAIVGLAGKGIRGRTPESSEPEAQKWQLKDNAAPTPTDLNMGVKVTDSGVFTIPGGFNESPEAAAAWAKQNPAGAAALMRADFPGEHLWADLGLPEGVNRKQRNAFQERVRQSLTEPIPEVSDAQQKQGTGPPDGSGGAQQVVQPQGGSPAVGSQGVQPGGQGGKAPQGQTEDQAAVVSPQTLPPGIPSDPFLGTQQRSPPKPGTAGQWIQNTPGTGTATLDTGPATTLDGKGPDDWTRKDLVARAKGLDIQTTTGAGSSTLGKPKDQLIAEIAAKEYEQKTKPDAYLGTKPPEAKRPVTGVKEPEPPKEESPEGQPPLLKPASGKSDGLAGVSSETGLATKLFEDTSGSIDLQKIWDRVKEGLDFFDPNGEFTGPLAATQLGRADNAAKRQEGQFAAAERMFEGMSQAKSDAWQDRYERGMKESDPKLRAIASAMDSMSKGMAAWTNTVTKGKKLADSDQVPYYLSGAVVGPGRAEKYAGTIAGGKLQGERGFLKERTFEFRSQVRDLREQLYKQAQQLEASGHKDQAAEILADAQALEFTSNNPITRQLQTWRAQAMYNASQQIRNAHEDAGYLRPVFDLKAQPEGFRVPRGRDGAPLTDYTRYGEDGKPFGYYALPDASARILENITSAGLSSKVQQGAAQLGIPEGVTKTAFVGAQAVRGITRAQIASNLFLSAWHPMAATYQMASYSIMEGLRGIQTLDFDRIAKAATRLAQTPIGWALKGSEVRGRQMKPFDQMTAQERTESERFVKGGGRVEQREAGAPRPIQDMRKAWAGLFGEDKTPMERAGYVGDIALHTPSAVIQAAVWPTMRFAENVKLAVTEWRQTDWMTRNPNATPEETRLAFRRIHTDSDHAFGQVQWANMFIPRALKDVTQVAFMAPGWTGGNLALPIMAAKDMARIPAQIAAGKPWMTDRMMMVPAQIIATGLGGALIQYMHTGKWPWETDTPVKDYFMPRTGNQTPEGQPERLAQPIMTTDWKHWSSLSGVGSTLKNKLSPIWSAIPEMIENRSYYGEQITDPERQPGETDHQYLWRLFTEEATHFLGERFKPFTVQAVQKLRKEGATPGQQVAAYMGLRPTSHADTDTASVAYLRSRQGFTSAPKTHEQAATTDLRTQIKDAYREGKTLEGIDWKDKIGPGELKKLRKEAHTERMAALYQQRPMNEALHAAELTTDEEWKVVGPILRKKWAAEGKRYMAGEVAPAVYQRLKKLYEELKRDRDSTAPVAAKEQ